jgi:hypothetical protein
MAPMTLVAAGRARATSRDRGKPRGGMKEGQTNRCARHQGMASHLLNEAGPGLDQSLRRPAPQLRTAAASFAFTSIEKGNVRST